MERETDGTEVRPSLAPVTSQVYVDYSESSHEKFRISTCLSPRPSESSVCLSSVALLGDESIKEQRRSSPSVLTGQHTS